MANQRFTLDTGRLGKKLKHIRESHKVKQKDVIEFLDMTRSGYASIEAGTYGTRIEVLANIILFYDRIGVNLSMEDLIGLERPKKKVSHDPILDGLKDMLLRQIDEHKAAILKCKKKAAGNAVKL
jgi:transcriptional regulator with XRE-family HTH domain